MSVEFEETAPPVASAEPTEFSIDGTGVPGDVVSISVANGTSLEAEVDEANTWRLDFTKSDLDGLPRISPAVIRVTSSKTQGAEEQIWLDIETGQIFDHDPAPMRLPSDCISLTDALALQAVEEDDPLTPYKVRMLDLNLGTWRAVSLTEQDLSQVTDIAALVIHGAKGHEIYENGLRPTGRSEVIGERDYTIYTLAGVDIVIDSEIKIVR